MERRIQISSIDNNPAVCFDTGLDPRSFARTKMSQSLIETGYVVSPDGTHETWRASGVNESNGSMKVFGPVFHGKRLDLLLDEIDSPANNEFQTALQAVVHWIRAKLFLGDTRSALNPGASFVSENGSVFFAPEHLSNRCLYIEGIHLDRYNCPDLVGMDMAAFCAGVMLYKIFTGVHPYPSDEIYQDMREGIYMPIHLAAPNINDKLSILLQSALLLPVTVKRHSINSTEILTELLEILDNRGNITVSTSALYKEVSAEKKLQIEKDRKLYQLKQNSIIKTRRFAVKNKHLLTGIAIFLVFSLFITYHTLVSLSQRPTTAGMTSEVVVTAYYEAFSSLNHMFMDAIIQGANRSDVNAAATLFAVVRTRQAYDMSNHVPIIRASEWRENGGELPAPNVFGVTDFYVTHMGGDEESRMIIYRANYMLWSPDENFARNRSDILTLRRDRRGNWRIIEILRTER